MDVEHLTCDQHDRGSEILTEFNSLSCNNEDEYHIESAVLEGM